MRKPSGSSGPIADFWTQHGVDGEIRVDARKMRLSRNCIIRLLGANACDGESVELALMV